MVYVEHWSCPWNDCIAVKLSENKRDSVLITIALAVCVCGSCCHRLCKKGAWYSSQVVLAPNRPANRLAIYVLARMYILVSRCKMWWRIVRKKKKRNSELRQSPGFYIYILCLLFWDVRRQPNLPQSCTAAPPPHLDCTTSNPFRTQRCFKAALPMCILDSNSYFSHLILF